MGEPCRNGLVGTSNVGHGPAVRIATVWYFRPRMASGASGHRCAARREPESSPLDVWSREYRGELGIALTDVINMGRLFCRDFRTATFAKLFDGARHDSGDPLRMDGKSCSPTTGKPAHRPADEVRGFQ